MEQSQIVFNLFVPADEYSAKAIHPTVRALHYPAPCLEADLPLEGLCLFLSRSNMQGMAKCFSSFPNLVVVIPFIQAKVLLLLFSRLWPSNRNALKCCLKHLEIGVIGTFHL